MSEVSGKKEKIEHAKHLIYEYRATRAALFCSFGKDSMVLLHLIREVFPGNKLSCHQYPAPVIYHRFPWFPSKQEFAESVIRSWGLETYDYLPLATGIKYNDKRLELVARYPFGDQGFDFPINTEPPLPRRDYVCGLAGWIMRPKSARTVFPWNTIFIGHKSSDVDPMDGAVPLKCDQTKAAGVNMVFPLRYWTDDDVWDYIESNHVPYDKRRYKDRAEIADHWLNPDYLHACTACIDPRNEATEVMCPKLGTMVPNRGKQVCRLQQMPDYIQKSEVREQRSEREEEHAI
jgi:3'-phosphoadenosine 5'-phosphosulfate sulfotransferase (PAPS reductase)/FAD synthetase